MTSTSWIWDVIAWASLPLLIILAGVMIWRRLEREFPFFFTYVSVTCVIGIVRLIAYKGYAATVYFYVWWSSDFVALLVTFLAIYEIFLRRLFPGFSRVRFYRYLFPTVAVVISLLAFLMDLHAPDTRAAFLVTGRIFDFLRSAVIGFFVLLILLMGRAFAGYEFSITSGFGIQAAIALANWAVRLHQGSKSVNMDHLESMAFDLACVIWLYSCARGKRPGVNRTGVAGLKTLQEARKWEKSLKDFITPGRR